jgi:serine/threonine-protein kinase
MSDTVQTTEDFLRIVRKSGLVEEPRLAAAVAAWTDPTQPLPEELVQALIDGGLLTQWQVDQLRKGRHKGFMLGKYRLLRLLGAGGMSSVYLAEHTTLHGLVAIKVLPVKRVDQTSYLARFEREAREAFRLNHPNIVRTIDLDTSGAIHFIAMEYVEGDDLHARVKQGGPLDVREAADFIRQAALGLQHAHEEGLVHRDIKPANLIVDKRGVVKILDFGLALAGSDDEAASLTQTHDEKVLGTADYLAPEQARDSHVADRRSDIYALGCTLHYLLTGRAPFAKGSIAERIQAHLKKPPPNLLDERADVPPPIAELYFRMLEKHPDARPQSAQEIADALSAWLAATATGAPRARPEPPRRQPPRRSPQAASDPGLSNVHYAPPQLWPGRSGPGSSSSGVPVGSGPGSRPANSGIDSGALVFQPTASPGARAVTASPPPSQRAPAATADSFPAVGVAVTPQVAGSAKDKQPVKKPVKKPLQFAGLPLAFWLLALGGVALAIGLAIAVLNKQ